MIYGENRMHSKLFKVIATALLLFAGAVVNAAMTEKDRRMVEATSVQNTQHDAAKPFDPDWWKTTVIYQIYPRSYTDSDGDGVGDLPGITSKLDYIASLGVRAIWISPFYESPQDDAGYDISNFTRIDPTFGTDADFVTLINEAHKRGIRVIMDLVPNHTSYKHEWFQKSRQKVGNFSDYYVWHAGDPKRPVRIAPTNATRNGVPNNWVSAFGNSMWTWDDERREYYLHQFLKEQPDLNYRNPLVREQMRNVMLYWLDRGADGFRIDAYPHTFEQEPYLNNDEPFTWNFDGIHTRDESLLLYDNFAHTKTKHQTETFLLLQEWRKMLQDYAAQHHRDHIFTMVEAYVNPGDSIELPMKYDTFNGTRGCDFAYNFDLINVSDANGHDIDRTVRLWLHKLPSNDSWPNWVTGNHDLWRLASRVRENQNLIDGFNMLLLLLPGTPTSYYGEEIGMSNNFDIAFRDVRDKSALTPAHVSTWQNWTRDFERTPMQWASQLPYAGFSPNTANKQSSLPWLPVNKNAESGISVEAQQQEENRNTGGGRLPTTHMGVYKKLIRLRDQKPFKLSKTMTRALVTPTLYSFLRKEQNAAKTTSSSPAAYLIAVDLRQNGTTAVQYDFSKVLADANISNASNGVIVVLSTATRSSSTLWQQAVKNMYNWSQISLLPGEAFVAEFA